MIHRRFTRSSRLRKLLAFMLAALGLAGSSARSQERGTESPISPAAPGAGTILVRLREGPQDPGRLRGLFAFTPDATNHFRQVGAAGLNDGRLSPGGRFLAAGPPANAPRDRDGVWIHDLSGSNPPRHVFKARWRAVSWTNGGTQLLVNAVEGEGQSVVYRVDADGSNQTRLPIAALGLVKFGTPDGSWLSMLESKRGANQHESRLTLVRDDGSESRVLVNEPDATIVHWGVAPNGKRVVYSMAAGELDATADSSVWIIDWNGESKKKVDYPFARGTIVRPVWSPDGSRLALGMTTVAAEGVTDRIVLVELDGTNPQMIKLPLLATGRPVLLDWK